jgi:molybdopterin molybdotransferase
VVGLLATGSELKDPGESLAPGQIYESNRTGLAPLIEYSGGSVKTYPIVPDAPDATCLALERALGECDLLVTCGGVSVGEKDFIKSAFERLRSDLQFWKVSVKPGRPFVFGRCAGKCLFGLPGNPVSALVTFLLLVRPALLRWSGATAIALPASPGVLAEPLQNAGSRRHFMSPGVLAEPLQNAGSRRHFMRVTMDPAGRVCSSGLQASHVLSSFASANGLVDVPPHTTLPAGSTVAVLRWE